MVVWSVADSLCHAGRLRIGFFDGFLLVDRIGGGLCCSNLGVQPCRLDGGRAVLLGHEQGRARIALLLLTLSAKVPAASPGALRGGLLARRCNGYLHGPDGLLRSFGEFQGIALCAEPVELGLSR